jgi:hypothetical protein
VYTSDREVSKHVVGCINRSLGLDEWYPSLGGTHMFNLGRHKVGAQHYRDLRISAFTEWSRAAA